MASKGRKSGARRAKSGSARPAEARSGASKAGRPASTRARGGEYADDASPEVKRLRTLLALMQEHDLSELEIGADGHSVRMSKLGPAPMSMPMMSFGGAPGAASPGSAAGAAGASTGTNTPAGAPEADPNVSFFLSPMVGTFYRAASPEAAPYSVVGDRVTPDSTLCIIEAMKVFNEIKAETSGTIVDILVENGEAVEYGQPLFAIRK